MSGIFFVGQCFKNNYFDFFIRDKTSYMFLFELCLWLAKEFVPSSGLRLKRSLAPDLLPARHQWLWISILSMARHCILTLFSNSLKTLAELFLLACLASGSVWPRKRCLWPDSLTEGSWPSGQLVCLPCELRFSMCSWKVVILQIFHAFAITNGRVLFFQAFHNLKGAEV